MALKVRIPAGEKFIVNGAVIANADDRAMHIRLENEADFLRSRDILQPEDAKTPLDEAYFHVQMLYIEPADREQRRRLFTDAARRAFLDAGGDEERGAIFNAVGDVGEGRFFAALSRLRDLRKAATGN